MSMKEAQELIVKNMRKWQKIENAGVASTGKIIDQTENPIVRLVMEIIQRDSQMHYRVQEMIADSLESKTLTLSPDELGTIWGMIEEHIKLEKSTIELAESSLGAIKKSKGMVVQAYLIEYLLKDEQKHDLILASLEKVHAGLYQDG